LPKEIEFTFAPKANSAFSLICRKGKDSEKQALRATQSTQTSGAELNVPSESKIHQNDIDPQAFGENPERVPNKTVDELCVSAEGKDEIVADTDVLQQSSSNESARISKGFNIRTDVVSKTILRMFKKHYITQFKQFHDFTKQRRNDSESATVINRAREFLTNFTRSEVGDTSIFLVALVDVKHGLGENEERCCQLRAQINSLLYSFNKRKFDALLKSSAFSGLLLQYLQEEDSIIHQVAQNRDEETTVSAYRRQIRSMRER